MISNPLDILTILIFIGLIITIAGYFLKGEGDYLKLTGGVILLILGTVLLVVPFSVPYGTTTEKTYIFNETNETQYTCCPIGEEIYETTLYSEPDTFISSLVFGLIIALFGLFVIVTSSLNIYEGRKENKKAKEEHDDYTDE